MDIVNGLRGVKRTVASFSLAALIASTFAIGVAQAQTFPDVNPSDWFYSYVEDLVVLGVVNGSMPAYRPADNVNRAEMAKLVVEAFDINLVSPGTPTFKDVAPGVWYYEYVETAAAHGIVGGYKDTEGTLTGFYGPGDPLTREQAAKMIVFGAPLDINTNCGPSFPDVAMNQWSYEFVETLYVNSVIDGYPNGTFGPNNNINRAEIAKVVSNAMAPVLRPCGGFSASNAKALSDTTVEVCFTGNYDATSAMMVENYTIEDQNGVELAVTSVEATSDPNCVLLTTDVQDGTKVYDLLVTDVMDANGTLLLSGYTTFKGYTVGDVGALTVRVDGSTPMASSIPRNASNVTYTVFNIAAGADEDVKIEELILTRTGLGLPGDFKSVKLYVDGIQKGSEKTINTSTNTATFALSGDPIIVKAGTSLLVEVRADMLATGAAVGSQNAFCISTSDDVSGFGSSTGEAVPVSGSFAACGNLMTTQSAFVGQITYEISDYVGDINVGDTNVTVSRLELDVNNVEDVDVTRVTFRQRGSADPADFANTTLYIGGTALDAVGVWGENKYLTFDLSSAPIFIERGNAKTLELRVDVVGGLNDTVKFDIYRDWHVEGVGRVYGYGVNVSEVAAPPGLGDRKIVGGNLAFALSSNNPTVGDVSQGAKDHIFMAFNLSTGGDGVTIRGFDIDVNYTGHTDTDEVSSVKIWRKNASGVLSVVAGPLDPGTCVLPGPPIIPCPSVTLLFRDTFDQAAGTTVEYFVSGSVDNNAPLLAVYSMDLNTATIDAEYLSNGDQVLAADISGGLLTGKDQTVAQPELTYGLALVPGDKNIVGGQQDVEVANWNFGASSASSIKMTSLTLTCTYVPGASKCADAFSNLSLYKKDGATYTLLQGGGSLSSNAGVSTVLFNNVNLTIPAGQTAIVALRANTTTSGLAGNTATWTIAANTDIVAMDARDRTLGAIQKVISGAIVDRELTFAGAGTLDILLSGSSPSDGAIIAGVGDNNVTRVRFEAGADEDVKITKLRLHQTGTDSRAVQTVALYDGATLLGSGALDSNNWVEFVNLNLVIPADGQKEIDVVVDTNDIAPGKAESNDDFTINFLDVASGGGKTFEAKTLDVKAIGMSSGQDVTSTDNISAAPVGNFVLYNTVPVLARTPGSPTSGGGANTTMLEFTFNVNGPSARTGYLTELVITPSGSCFTNGNDSGSFTLYRGNTLIGNSGVANYTLDVSEFLGVHTNIGQSVNTGGSPVTLQIKTDTTGCAVDETLQFTVDSFGYNDGKVDYDIAGGNEPNILNSYRHFDSTPFPLEGHLFKF